MHIHRATGEICPSSSEYHPPGSKSRVPGTRHHRSDPERRTAGRSHVHAAAANRRTELEEAARGVWRHPTRLDRGSIKRLNLSPSHKMPPLRTTGVAVWCSPCPAGLRKVSRTGTLLDQEDMIELRLRPCFFESRTISKSDQRISRGKAPTFGIWVGRAWTQRRESRHFGALPRFQPLSLYYRDWLAGDAVGIKPVSARIPCKQGILQGILRFQGPKLMLLGQKSPVLQRFFENSLRRLTGNRP